MNNRDVSSPKASDLNHTKLNIKRRIQSFRYAFQGIITLFTTQPNAIIHLIAALVAVAMGLWLGLSSIEWSVLTLTIAVVLSAEAVNTAIEFVVDLVSPDYHPLAGKAKDVAAAAVLILAIAAVIVGILIFLPKLLLFL